MGSQCCGAEASALLACLPSSFDDGGNIGEGSVFQLLIFFSPSARRGFAPHNGLRRLRRCIWGRIAFVDCKSEVRLPTLT